METADPEERASGKWRPPPPVPRTPTVEEVGDRRYSKLPDLLSQNTDLQPDRTRYIVFTSAMSFEFDARYLDSSLRSQVLSALLKEREGKLHVETTFHAVPRCC